MKINENVKILGQKCVLVPYEAKHVPKYYNWLGDEEIRRLTASDRLTLEEEYEMQKSWRNDDDKLTFIVLDKSIHDEKPYNEENSMVGDVNLFISEEEGTSQAEVEVMIAEEVARGKGIATEAVSLIIGYAIENLKIKKFFVKITDDNNSSLHIFEKKLGFTLISHSKVFGEYNLELDDSKIPDFRKNFIDGSKILQYTE